MRIRTNRQIELVIAEKRVEDLKRVAVNSYILDDYDVEDVEDAADADDRVTDAMHDFETGIQVAEKHQKMLAKYGGKPPKDFGLHIAARPGSNGGDDIFYFLGSATEIIRKLERLPSP